jgi:hypothetical protein
VTDDLDKPVVCRFRYTTREYRKAMALRTRATTAKSYFYMAIPLVILAFVLYPQAAVDYRAALAGKTPSQAWQAAFSDMMPLAFVVGMVGLLFTPVAGFFYALFFRGQINHNRIVEWTIATTALRYSSEVAQSDFTWAVVERVRENKNGILLQVGRRQFIWMSNQGFQSDAERSRARQMIRSAVRDFKSYGSEVG